MIPLPCPQQESQFRYCSHRILTSVANIISQERLSKYIAAAGGDSEFALELYGWNIQISEAFFPILSAAESYD